MKKKSINSSWFNISRLIPQKLRETKIETKIPLFVTETNSINQAARFFFQSLRSFFVLLIIHSASSSSTRIEYRKVVTGFNYVLIVDSLSGWNQTTTNAWNKLKRKRYTNWRVRNPSVLRSHCERIPFRKPVDFQCSRKRKIIIIDIPVVVSIFFYLGKNDWGGKQKSMAVIIQRAKVTSPFRAR